MTVSFVEFHGFRYIHSLTPLLLLLQILRYTETRRKVGLDPLLQIIRKLFPSAFESSSLTKNDMIKDGINQAKHYRESELFRIFLLPNHSLAVN